MAISEIDTTSSDIECPYTGERGCCESCVIGLSPQECEEALYEYLMYGDE